MATYVYSCSACEQTFEIEQRMSEDPLTTCVCGKSGQIGRVPQRAGVIFNGSGFYVNDSQACAGDQKSCRACAPQE